MKVNSSFVKEFRAIRANGAAGQNIKAAKKDIWKRIRAAYNITEKDPLAMEIDSGTDLLGQLRYKKRYVSPGVREVFRPEPGEVSAAPAPRDDLVPQGHVDTAPCTIDPPAPVEMEEDDDVAAEASGDDVFVVFPDGVAVIGTKDKVFDFVLEKSGGTLLTKVVRL